jgi:hypothetical protein
MELYEKDFSEAIYAKACEMGLQPRRTPRGWSIRCPHHDDAHHSAKVFNDDGWAACFAGCQRWNFVGNTSAPRVENYAIKVKEAPDYDDVDYFDYWLGLDPIVEDCKGIPARYLNSLGWRQLPSGNEINSKGGIFIPAFTTSRTAIPFCQIRHDGGDRRFSFPSRVKPLVFGFENLECCQTYVPFTERNTVAATLRLLGIPCLAFPSGSSGELLRKLGRWANKQGRILVACSDSDAVGDKFLSNLDTIAPYIDARPRGYKDYNDMYNDGKADKIREELEWLIPNNKSKHHTG